MNIMGGQASKLSDTGLRSGYILGRGSVSVSNAIEQLLAKFVPEA
jgi:hypothetical protein